MQYYRLVNKESEEDLILVNDYDLKGFDIRKLWRGEKIDWNTDIKLYYEKKGKALDYIPNVMSWLIFSDKVIELFNKLDIKDIQVIPINLSRKGDTDEFYNYNLVNILLSISALNRDKSEYLKWEDNSNDIKFIRKAVINRVSLKDEPDIFLLAEGTVFVVISKKLKDAFENSNISGVDFISIETI